MTTAQVAVIVEPLVRPGKSVAHLVRTTIGSMLAAGAIVIGCFQAFTLAHGVENRLFDGLPETQSASAAVDQVVREQQSLGLTCRPEAALTDRVVFQYGSGEFAALLTLRGAVSAQKAGAGSIQRYCF
ncbi:MAG: hypothetical protein WB508_02840 [Aeromicrobium sp.]|uniref:hypothetical protein n=1 Tax=Aeromicrobium sp. TaxID=1871063 RepID=UPI003C33E166